MNARLIQIILVSMLGAISLNVRADDECGYEGSTAWASCNNYKSFEAADKKLNDAYRRFVTVMNKPAWQKAKQKLIAAQRAWIIFRDKECEFSQELIGGASHVNQTECLADMTKERAEYIEGLYKSYK